MCFYTSHATKAKSWGLTQKNNFETNDAPYCWPIKIQSFDNQTSKFTRPLGNVLAPLTQTPQSPWIAKLSRNSLKDDDPFVCTKVSNNMESWKEHLEAVLVWFKGFGAVLLDSRNCSTTLDTVFASTCSLLLTSLCEWSCASSVTWFRKSLDSGTPCLKFLPNLT